MTSHYIDIRVRPDPETGMAQLLGALYQRFHLALVQQHLDSIGVSFPDYSKNPRTLDNRLRLHGTDKDLQQFMQADWLKGMRDHVRLAEIAPVPEDVGHRNVQRRQFKTNVERLRRRRMKRKGESAEQAKAGIPRTAEQRPDLPYVHLRSRSTGQPFCLFIAMGPLQSQPVSGHFNSHGLSTTTTVPWF